MLLQGDTNNYIYHIGFNLYNYKFSPTKETNCVWKFLKLLSLYYKNFLNYKSSKTVINMSSCFETRHIFCSRVMWTLRTSSSGKHILLTLSPNSITLSKVYCPGWYVQVLCKFDGSWLTEKNCQGLPVGQCHHIIGIVWFKMRYFWPFDYPRVWTEVLDVFTRLKSPRFLFLVIS